MGRYTDTRPLEADRGGTKKTLTAVGHISNLNIPSCFKYKYYSASSKKSYLPVWPIEPLVMCLMLLRNSYQNAGSKISLVPDKCYTCQST